MEPPRPPLLKRLSPAHWTVIDCAAAAAAVFLADLQARGAAGPGGVRWTDVAVIVVSLVAAGFRRRWSRRKLVLAVAVCALGSGLSVFPAPWIAGALVMYLVPQRFPRREALWLLGGALAVTGAGAAGLFRAPQHRPGPGGTGPLLVSVLLVTVAWTIGFAVRQQRAYEAGRREQAERRASERVAEARRASGEERLRIARELHDVVAHTVSLIAVQAGVANYVIGTDPEEAARALSSIEQTSRGALRELRSLLGVLRADGPVPGPADLAPVPGLGDLDCLVERTAEAGVRVELDVRGEQPPLSAGVDLAAYRVIQEAVTNVVKHAAAESCRVTVDYRQDALALEITDSGAGPDGAREPAGAGEPAGGHGIIGMRERVAVYGGEFLAAPLPGRGFRVSATFPLAETVETAGVTS
jgi:signal transduction histidine kinase